MPSLNGLGLLTHATPLRLSSSVRSELKQQETCQALLQQGGTLGQKEAETEDQVGKKTDGDSENDQDPLPSLQVPIPLSPDFQGSVSECLYAERRVEEPGMFAMPADWLAARQVAAAEPFGMSPRILGFPHYFAALPALNCIVPERSFEMSAKGISFE
ncbi:hypothetical protein CapIbe_007182 [Capra ibex]